VIAAALIGLLAQDAPPAAFLTIPAEYRLIEGVAADGDTIWVSSVLDRSIVAHRNGRFTAHKLPKGDGAPLGIAWDARRGWLWIAANCPADLHLPDCTGAALLAMDRKGRVRVRLAPQGSFTPGDVSVWQDRVFVSDSSNGAVYRCSGKCSGLSAVIKPRAKGSAQGTAVYDQGRRLLVADYGLGLISVDLETGTEAPILLEDGSRLRGVDGLIADGDSFLGVRNASVPGKVWRFRIANDRVADPQVAGEGGAIVDPTQVARAGRQVLVVADSQWSAYLPDKAGRISGVQRPTPIVALPAR
jgi:hypothetical protein